MCFTYLSPNSIIPLENIFKGIDPHMEYCLVVGDLNSRIGMYQNSFPLLSYQCRKSNDKRLNSRGRELIRLLDEKNFCVLNGASESDRHGNFTFMNKNGSSVIDLCIASQNLYEHLDLEVLEAEESSHFPVLITFKQISIPEIVNKVVKIRYDKTKQIYFQENLENILTYHDSDKIDMPTLTNNIIKAASDTGLVKTSITRKSFNHGPIWFDQKCVHQKTRMRKLLRQLRKEKRNDIIPALTNKYLGEKRAYQNLLKAKKLKFMSSLDKNLSNSRNATQFYKALSYYHTTDLKDYPPQMLSSQPQYNLNHTLKSK
jgi:hypothetical protein